MKEQTSEKEQPQVARHTDYLEIQKQRKEFERSINPKNQRYAKCLENFREWRDFEMIYWRHYYIPQDLPEFFYTPPVAEAVKSDRIVMMGNLNEMTDVDNILEGVGPYLKLQKAAKSIRNGGKKIKRF